jgi:hypothetical protein
MQQLMQTARMLEAEWRQVLHRSMGTGTEEDKSSTGHIWATGFHCVTAHSWLTFWNLQTDYFFSFQTFCGGRSQPQILNQQIWEHDCTAQKHETQQIVDLVDLLVAEGLLPIVCKKELPSVTFSLKYGEINCTGFCVTLLREQCNDSNMRKCLYSECRDNKLLQSSRILTTLNFKSQLW